MKYTKLIIAALIAAITLTTGCKWFKHESGSGGSDSSIAEKAKFDWCYGGLNGSKAVEDANAQIKDLKIAGNNMSYSWAKGNLRGWGLADSSADALACVFFKDGKTYKGGKFEWISYSRKTRSFGNITTRYAGWDPNKFFSASEYAFCICSKDGKKRTNFIFFSKNSREPTELIWVENCSRVVPLQKAAPKKAAPVIKNAAPAKPAVVKPTPAAPAKKPEPSKVPAKPATLAAKPTK